MARNVDRELLGCALGAAVAVLAAVGWAVHVQWQRWDDPAPLPRTSPVSHEGRPWRIACYQSGDVHVYRDRLRALAVALAEDGWIEPVSFDGVPDDTKAVWQALVDAPPGAYLRFLPDGYYSADWDWTRRKQVRQDLLSRCKRGQIDLILALGTWAGQDLRDGHDVPTVVMGAGSPELTGVIDSADDSGREHLHALADPERYRRQIRAFHSLVGFRRIGVLAEDTPTGLVSGSVADLRHVADERGFEVVWEPVDESGKTQAECRAAAKEAIARLRGRIDAFWIGGLRSLVPQELPEVIEPLLEDGVPTWGALGDAVVRRGVLMAMPARDVMDEAHFHARAIGLILHGRSPRDIPMYYPATRALVVNRETARRIGFELPPSLALVVDRMYDRIERDKEQP